MFVPDCNNIVEITITTVEAHYVLTNETDEWYKSVENKTGNFNWIRKNKPRFYFQKYFPGFKKINFNFNFKKKSYNSI